MPAAEVERAAALIRSGGDDDRDALTVLLLAESEADGGGDGGGGGSALAGDFAELIARGLYDAMIALLRRARPGETDVLLALAAARPTWNADALNADALALMQSGGPGRAEWDLLIVPGYTPLGASRPMALEDCLPAVARLEMARADLERFVAPFILLTGGAVHPPGTPNVEALMMRDYLLAHGVPPERVVVDPFARHSTTNLRNAGRVMVTTGMGRGLIVTGFESDVFDQAFYFSHPIVSTFQQRCRAELGYVVGVLEDVDEHRVGFVASGEVVTRDCRDPVDW